MNTLTIGRLADAGGVGVETVRYYQRRGLLDEPPLAIGASRSIRRYGEVDIRRLRFIRAAQRAGFTLEEIGELIALDAGHDHERARAIATQRLTALDARIAELTIARTALARLATLCTGSTSGPCPILSAFEPDGL